MKNKNVYLYKEIVEKFGFRDIWSVRDFCKRNNIKRKIIEGIACDKFIKENSELFNSNKLPYRITLVDKKDFEQIYHKKKGFLSASKLTKVSLKAQDEPVLNILKELLQEVKHLEDVIKNIANNKKKEEFKIIKEDNAKNTNKTIEALNQIEKQKKQYAKNSYEEYVLEKDEINKLIMSLKLTGPRLRLYYSYLEYITGVNLNKYREELLRTYSLKGIGSAERKRMYYIKNIIIEDPTLRKPFLNFLREREKERIKASAS